MQSKTVDTPSVSWTKRGLDGGGGLPIDSTAPHWLGSDNVMTSADSMYVCLPGVLSILVTNLSTRNPMGPFRKDSMTDTHCLGRPACHKKASSIGWDTVPKALIKPIAIQHPVLPSY